MFLVSDVQAGDVALGEGGQDSRVAAADTVFYDNEFPVINIRNVGGDAVIVEGAEIEDIFSYTSSATQVVVTIEPPSGDSLTVTTLSGPTWTEDYATGYWEATFSVPSPGGETSGSFEVSIDGSTGMSNSGNFKIKKQSDGGG